MDRAPEPPLPGYDADAADLYDADVAESVDSTACVATLAALAHDGPALELGVGTGRVAIALAQRGIALHGIDNSAAMLERLRGKPGGELVTTVDGDFAQFALDERFALVFVVFDTITALDTQDAQASCFASVAAHLQPGGVFVVEASVPERAPRTDAATGGYSLLVKSMRPDRVQLEASWHDAVEQKIYTQWIYLRDGGVRMFRFAMRYAWPAELDLMARLAGLRLLERWGGWDRQAFTSSSQVHVSVYGPLQR